jgi:myo-inositol-hexaphosphate 3-phosphohydrolase
MKNSRVIVLASVGAILVASPTSAAAPSVSRKAVDVVYVSSVAETDPVGHSGDAADDPAIWVNSNDPSQSLVIGNDKRGALETYSLSGARVQRIAAGSGFFGNVDVRGDYVAVSHNGVVVYEVRPSTRQLALATDGSGKISSSGEGLCLYDPGADGLGGGLFAFTVGRSDGRVREYALSDADGDGMMSGAMVRDFTIGSESEGCVADDATGSFFVSEEDVAVWRYGADPGDGTARAKVAAVGPSLPADAEGLAIAGAYLFVSAQNVSHPGQNFIDVYLRTPPYSYVRSVRIVDGPHSDDCDRTDGIDAYAGSLGSAFPHGLLVCQDGDNAAPGTTGNQDFKLVPLQAVTAGS